MDRPTSIFWRLQAVTRKVACRPDGRVDCQSKRTDDSATTVAHGMPAARKRAYILRTWSPFLIQKVPLKQAAVSELNPGPCDTYPPTGWVDALAPCCCAGGFGPTSSTFCPGTTSSASQPHYRHAPRVCSGHGVCMGSTSVLQDASFGTCYCDASFSGTDCSHPSTWWNASNPYPLPPTGQYARCLSCCHSWYRSCCLCSSPRPRPLRVLRLPVLLLLPVAPAPAPPAAPAAPVPAGCRCSAKASAESHLESQPAAVVEAVQTGAPVGSPSSTSFTSFTSFVFPMTASRRRARPSTSQSSTNCEDGVPARVDLRDCGRACSKGTVAPPAPGKPTPRPYIYRCAAWWSLRSSPSTGRKCWALGSSFRNRCRTASLIDSVRLGTGLSCSLAPGEPRGTAAAWRGRKASSARCSGAVGWRR